ncbi:FTR1 family iron permease [Candidatus Methylocalor cossyra]|uniref:High-affinity iron transporter n=1 Tax=Candidatus Methylocalor cossyra TaxID=3108543 RepID=A0ABM9NJ31_9GAMM
MLATAIIVFREVVEAALVIGIVMAASRGVARRGRWVGSGVLGGLLGACVVAGLADRLAEVAAGMGQELFNAIVLFTAVALLGWHNVWMQRHGRELAQQMTRVGRAVLSGERPLYALAVVVGLAVLREGAEVVLFLYGIASAGEGSAISMLTGGALGIALGSALGLTLYFGLLRIPARHLFTVTSGLILFLAAGMAAQGAAYLIQADWLPPLGREVWNTSEFLSEESPLGQILHTLVGYVARPDGMQIVFYLATLAIIGGLMRRVGGGSKTHRPAS